MSKYDELLKSDDIEKCIETINTITRTMKDLQYRRKLIDKIIDKVDENRECFLIPYIKPDLYISKSIALVGSSINLLNEKYGEEIDKHTNVIRFKYAPVKGFEEYCGSKENIRLTNIFSFNGKRYASHPVGLVEDYNIYKKIETQF